MKTRQSNFELLRIVAMFFIVIGHFMNQGDYYSYAGGANKCLGFFAGSASRIFVNVFLFIGIWFMVDSKFAARRLVKLYLNTWTYTFVLAIAVLVLGFHPEMKYVATGIFPFIGKNLWFVSTYIALLLLSPWLQNILLLNKKSLRNLVIVSFLLISGFTTVWAIKGVDDDWLNGLMWFVFTYIAIGYYKKFCLEYHINKLIILVLGITIYVILVYLPYVYLIIGNNRLTALITQFCNAFIADYKSIPNFAIAFCIFEFFRQLDLGSNKYINYIASGSFATYVIHQTHVFIPVLWHDILKCDYFFKTDYSFIYSIIATCLIYLVCLIVERLRLRYLEHPMLDNRFSKLIQMKIDGFYQM